MTYITAPGEVIKTEFESVKYFADFKALLDSGETIDTVDSITPKHGEDDITIDPDEISTSGTKVLFRVADGTAGGQYRLQVKIETSSGNKRQLDCLLSVE